MQLRRRDWTLLVLACVAGGLALIRFLPGLLAALPSCMFQKVTGWNCPGCGGTRCVIRLAHGDLVGAVGMNPIVVLYGALAIGWLSVGVLQEARGRRAPALPSWTGWLLGGGVLLFGILRNLPWWPFTLLAPHA
jgi:hypothetical protein